MGLQTVEVFVIQLARDGRLDLLLDIYYCLSLYKRVCYG